MNISKSIVLFMVIIFVGINFGYTQNITISGYVSDMETGERLIGASIYESNSGNVVISNNYGFYSLQISKNESAVISVSYLGYTSFKEELVLKNTLKFNIQLVPENYLLDEVGLVASKETPINKRTELGVLSISVKEMEKLPALGGEVDVLKTLQLMPGVQSGNEGSSGLYVRGGSPDQNLVLLDDVPMYYVNHLGGFVSTFNIDAISSVKLTKGGFPAHNGGRLSSILDIRMKDGDMKKFHGSGMIGMVAAKVAIEGPIKKDTTSYMISARRMLYDLFTRPISKVSFNGISLGYTFYDFNAKINHNFSERDRIYFSTYLGNDRSIVRKKGEDAYKSTLEWGNNLAALRWNHVYGAKLFSNVTVSYTRYRFLTETSGEFTSRDESFQSSQSFLSGIYDLGVKADFELYVSPNYKFKFGGNSIYHTFKPGATTIEQSVNGQSTQNERKGTFDTFARENALYVENEVKFGKIISANFGIRSSVYNVNGKDFLSIEPRILTNVLLGNKVSFKAAYSKMQQNVHLLTNSGVGLPTDLWLPATDIAAPQNSEQFSFGIVSSLKQGFYEFSLEGYHKTMNNLIEYKDGSNFIGTAKNWEDLVETEGIGTSYGLELLLQKKVGRTTGWIGYTWSKTDRKFNNLNGGNPFPYRYDRRHDASVVVTQRLNEKIDISGTWVYGTGAAFTLPIAKYDIIDANDSKDPFSGERRGDFSEAFIYGERNANRMRAYHRLDVGVNFHKKKKWGERVLNISIYNLYARQNPYFYFVETETPRDFEGNLTGEETTALFQQSLFPILPSISYSFKF